MQKCIESQADAGMGKRINLVIPELEQGTFLLCPILNPCLFGFALGLSPLLELSQLLFPRGGVVHLAPLTLAPDFPPLLASPLPPPLSLFLSPILSLPCPLQLSSLLRVESCEQLGRLEGGREDVVEGKGGGNRALVPDSQHQGDDGEKSDAGD